MSVKWDGARLLKSIAENEVSAAKLYRAIAENANIGEKFFEKLAEDEERHKKIYDGLLKKYAEDLELNLEKDDAEYIDLLIDNNTVFDESLIDKAKHISVKSQILDIAERSERDAVLFVTELQRLFPNLAKDEVEIILKEEKKHLQFVLEKKKLPQPYMRGL